MPEINVGAPVGAFVDWLTANFGPLFHAISTVMLVLLDAVLIVLTAPSPYLVILVLVALALLERKWGFGLFTLLAFLLILAMGLWVEAMQTLALTGGVIGRPDPGPLRDQLRPDRRQYARASRGGYGGSRPPRRGRASHPPRH